MERPSNLAPKTHPAQGLNELLFRGHLVSMARGRPLVISSVDLGASPVTAPPHIAPDPNQNSRCREAESLPRHGKPHLRASAHSDRASGVFLGYESRRRGAFRFAQGAIWYLRGDGRGSSSR